MLTTVTTTHSSLTGTQQLLLTQLSSMNTMVNRITSKRHICTKCTKATIQSTLKTITTRLKYTCTHSPQLTLRHTQTSMINGTELSMTSKQHTTSMMRATHKCTGSRPSLMRTHMMYMTSSDLTMSQFMSNIQSMMNTETNSYTDMTPFISRKSLSLP